MIISNHIQIPLTSLSPELLEEIKTRLTFKNPAYGEALRRLRAMGRPNAKPRDTQGKPIPMQIIGWKQTSNSLIVPRGIANELSAFTDLPIKDSTRILPKVDFKFLLELRPYQQEAVEVLLGRKFATLVCPTGGGKTIIGCYMIAARQQPVCIVVHTNKLVRQWAERIAGSADGKHPSALDITHEEIGYITEGKVDVGKRITIALVQTLRNHINQVYPYFGHLLFDECHHLPAYTFNQVAVGFDCRFSLGLSATPKRKDGKTPMIFWSIGPIVHEISYGRLVQEGWILPPEPIIRETNFNTGIEAYMEVSYYDLTEQEKVQRQREKYQQKADLITELIHDRDRNLLIINDIKNELDGEGACLVLSERTDHCEILAELAEKQGIKVAVSHGKLPKKKQHEAEMALRHGEVRVLAATGQLLGEGFDESVPSALFIVTPISFSERLKQYLGRIGRPAEDKAAKVYDYVDIYVPTLMRAANERLKTYKKLQKEIVVPTPRKKS